MTEQHLLHESIVQDSEIDSLGHMNVRYYITRASAANEQLLEQVGVRTDGDEVIRRIDTYTKFQREQFAGAPLQVTGGLIDVEGVVAGSGQDGAVTAFFDIRNAESGAVAASFIISSVIANTRTQEVTAPPLNPGQRSSFLIQAPEHGLPRSLSLASPKVVPLEELEPLIPTAPTPGMMSGRYENVVLAEDCDDNGRLREDIDVMFVMHRPQPGQDLKQMGPPLSRDALGRRYSWAMMETRSVSRARPSANERVVSLSADVRTGEKWRQSRRWMFSRDSGELLGTSDTLGMCIDLDARKAIPIPAELRDQIEQNCLPELR